MTDPEDPNSEVKKNRQTLQPSGVPPVGTTTATSFGRDYTLGATRSLESPAGRAERLARRYLRKFGSAGAAAASELLKQAADKRLGGSPIRTQSGRGKEAAARAEAEKEDIRVGEEAKEQLGQAVTMRTTSGLDYLRPRDEVNKRNRRPKTARSPFASTLPSE